MRYAIFIWFNEKLLFLVQLYINLNENWLLLIYFIWKSTLIC